MENIFFAAFVVANALSCLMGRNELHTERTCCLQPWWVKVEITPETDKVKFITEEQQKKHPKPHPSLIGFCCLSAVCVGTVCPDTA